MFKKLLSTPTIFLCFILFTTTYGFGQNQEVIRFKSQQPTNEQDVLLKQQFKAYALTTLRTDQVSELLHRKDYFPQLLLEVNGQSYSFSLRAKDVRAPHYKLRVLTDQGVVELPRSRNNTFSGYSTDGGYDVRITSDTNFFYGMLVEEHDELYIEPARHLVPGAPKNQFVVYRASDNLKKFSEESCGVRQAHTPDDFEDNGSTETTEEEFSGRVCKVVQVALADDHLMFNKYGSITEVEDHNMAVINNVETNYDFEFNVDLEFSIVEIFIATTAGNDPFSTSTNPDVLLTSFTNWGPNGFDNTHDVAGLWSDRDFDGSTIGLAWLGSVCTSFRYHIMEDFSTNANFLRVLQAHEMGHNFNANHDAAGSNTIMAPAVNSSNTWSGASISAIDNYINQVSCLGPCGAAAPPVAAFDADPTIGCIPMVVSYDDQSTNNPTTWSWIFEGGTPGTSSNPNPTITYTTPGTFNVSLTVSNSQGSDNLTISDFITVGEPPVADFTYTINELEVDFQNESSNATSYLWNFGDGGTSTQFNPLHEYAEDGVYLVTLTATNECGSDVFVQEIEIITLPVASFSSDIVEGCDPMEVEFINLSSPNALYFNWSFPGGSPPSSNNFEPTIVYETPGTFNVTLTVSNEAGDDVQTITNYITVNPQPGAEFSFTTNGLQAIFNSNGSVGTTYSWNFGDGQNSNVPNPIHVYSVAGTYTVSLTVSNECGSEILTLNVTVTGAPIAAFTSNTQYGCAPLVVQFTNQSAGSPTSFNWIFEGGSPATSTQANPTVTYNTPGLYDVQLTVTNPAGNNTLLLDNYIEVETPTNSDFNYSVNGSNANFTNQSSNDIGSTWHFGDGNSSPETSPSHTYLSDGVYTVMLISAGICGNDTSTSQISIQTPPQAGYSYQQLSDCIPAIVDFTNQSSPNATTFLWSFPGGSPSSSTQANPSVTYTSVGAYTVTLIAYSGGGTDTLSWENLIVIGSVPSASFLLSTDDINVTFENQTIGASSYFWDFGDGQFSTSENPVHDYDSFGIYTVSLISTNPCGSDTAEIVIELSTVPNAFFSYSTHTGCSPFVVNFVDQSQNNPTSWEWAFEGGEPATSTLQNPTVTYTVPGAHTVSLTVTNGQGSDALVLDGLIQVGGTPDATFIHTQTENSVALEYPGVDYDSLHWSFGDGRTDNSLNPTVEYTVSGQYQISLIVYNACGTDTSSVWVTITITSTAYPSINKSGWQIRPNPFKDNLTIYGEPLVDGTATISLLDVHGKIISTEYWIHSSGQVLKEINADQLPSGVVLVLIQDHDSRVVLKAVHQ
jgi:PKD repeat protein